MLKIPRLIRSKYDYRCDLETLFNVTIKTYILSRKTFHHPVYFVKLYTLYAFYKETTLVDPILKANDLHKYFDVLIAVHGVSFQIAQGEIYSLLDPNGAGKTTMISMLTGLLSPTQGDAEVDSHYVVKDANRVKEMNGVVPQEIAMYPTITAHENLAFWGKMYGLREN